MARMVVKSKKPIRLAAAYGCACKCQNDLVVLDDELGARFRITVGSEGHDVILSLDDLMKLRDAIDEYLSKVEAAE